MRNQKLGYQRPKTPFFAAETGHDLADFNFLPFEKIRSSDPFVIEARESFWIEKYGVLGEGGINRRS